MGIARVAIKQWLFHTWNRVSCATLLYLLVCQQLQWVLLLSHSLELKERETEENRKCGWEWWARVSPTSYSSLLLFFLPLTVLFQSHPSVNSGRGVVDPRQGRIREVYQGGSGRYTGKDNRKWIRWAFSLFKLGSSYVLTQASAA